MKTTVIGIVECIIRATDEETYYQKVTLRLEVVEKLLRNGDIKEGIELFNYTVNCAIRNFDYDEVTEYLARSTCIPEMEAGMIECVNGLMNLFKHNGFSNCSIYHELFEMAAAFAKIGKTELAKATASQGVDVIKTLPPEKLELALKRAKENIMATNLVDKGWLLEYLTNIT